jgi:hypothetical protein
MTTEDMLFVVWLCVEQQATYGHQSNRAFWKRIARRLMADRGKEHQTLNRAVAKLVRERRAYLAELDSGEQDTQSSMTDALDAWITVLDAREEVKQARREAQGTADAETTASMAWRQASLALWADKTQLLRAASRAHQQEDEEDESSATPATPDPMTPEPTTRRRRRPAPPAPVIPLEGDPVAAGLERLFSIVESAASRIGSTPKEEEREEKDAAVEKRLEDLELKVSTVNDNVAQMLVLLLHHHQHQQRGN